MPKKVDFSVRADRQRLLERLTKIIRAHEALDSPERLLNMSQRDINKLVKRYITSTRKELLKFFAGRPINKLVVDAERDFRKAMKQVPFVLKKSQRKALIRSVKRQFNAQILSILDEIEGRQQTKLRRFKLMAENQAQTLRTIKEELKNVFTIGSRVFDVENVRDTWQIMQRRFGKYDTVLFRPNRRTGVRAKFPLRQYVEQRTITTANEAHRIATMVEASRNQVLVGRISSHGSRDSCILHEGELVFFSEAARRVFRSKFPEIDSSRWRTLQQLEDDDTHIFKPNCKHIVTPVPALQFAATNTRKRLAKEQKLQTIPRKIDERAFA